MRLTEFYALSESRTQHYTIEPEANGVGRLLGWETVSYTGPGAEEADAEDDTSYEVLAHGDIEKLLLALHRQMPESSRFDEDIRSAYDQCVSSGGEAVYVDPHGVDITVKSGKGDVQIEDVEY